MDEDLARRLEAIERRLAALESRFTTPPPLPASAVKPAVTADTGIDERGAAVPSGSPQDVTPPASPASTPPMPPASAAAMAALAEANRRRREAMNVLAVTPAEHKFVLPDYDLEREVGLKWAGWIGGVVLVIGAALGLKFAFDNGYFRSLPDDLRCGLIAAGGLALLAAGEFVYRRVNRIAAAGFYGAGVGVLYLAAYAAQGWYGLFGPTAAMFWLGVVAAIGMAVAARADLVAVAAIAMTGAVVCPALTGAIEHRTSGFRVYLLAIEAMALGLCAWRATPKWWVLRGVALASTVFDLFVGAAGQLPRGFVWPGMVFALLAAAGYQAELLFTAWRRPRDGPIRPAAGVVFSFLVTAVLCVMLLARLSEAPAWVRGEMLLWLALAVTTTGLFVARRSVLLAQLGRGYYVQGMAVLALAVPVTLDGPTMLFGWMTLAVGLAVLGVAARDALTTVGAACVWVLAACGTMAWALDPATAAQNVWLPAAGEGVRAASVVALALAVSGHWAAFALHRVFTPAANHPGDPADVTGGLLLDLAAAGAFALVLAVYQSTAFVSGVGVAYGLTLWAASWTPGLPTLRPVGLIVLASTAIKWAAADVVLPRLTHRPPNGMPVYNVQTATGLALAAALRLTSWLDRRRGCAGVGITLSSLAVMGVLLVAGSAEVDRYAVSQTEGPVWVMRQVGLSIYWAALAVASLAVGFAWRDKPLRIAALLLLAVTLAKVVAIDLAGVGTGWRILSFVGLGVLLLLTSVLYGRSGTGGRRMVPSPGTPGEG